MAIKIQGTHIANTYAWPLKKKCEISDGALLLWLEVRSCLRWLKWFRRKSPVFFLLLLSPCRAVAQCRHTTLIHHTITAPQQIYFEANKQTRRVMAFRMWNVKYKIECERIHASIWQFTRATFRSILYIFSVIYWANMKIADIIKFIV